MNRAVHLERVTNEWNNVSMKGGVCASVRFCELHDHYTTPHLFPH